MDLMAMRLGFKKRRGWQPLRNRVDWVGIGYGCDSVRGRGYLSRLSIYLRGEEEIVSGSAMEGGRGGGGAEERRAFVPGHLPIPICRAGVFLSAAAGQGRAERGRRRLGRFAACTRVEPPREVGRVRMGWCGRHGPRVLLPRLAFRMGRPAAHPKVNNNLPFPKKKIKKKKTFPCLVDSICLFPNS